MTALLAGACAVTAFASGCRPGAEVVRVYDGQIAPGPYVQPEAYAHYLRGVIAEGHGDFSAALSSFEQAADIDADDPEVWTRIGDVRCRRDPKDSAADRAFSKALKIDASYAGALAAKGRCELTRGKTAEAAELVARATQEDPKRASLGALLVQIEARRGTPAARERAIALTVTQGHDENAWNALLAWGQARGDAGLVARALIGLLPTAPMRSPEVERGALDLLGEGQLVLARQVAAAVADAPRELDVHGPRDATVARLAVDEALSRGDEAAATARATRGHVSLPELAARALVFERAAFATSLARTVAHADPGASAAHMVLAAIAKRDEGAKKGGARHPGESLRRITDQPPELCALVFAERLTAAAGADVAREWLANVTRTPMAPHDPVAGPFVVDLAARGVIAESALPREWRIELAARRREAPPPMVANAEVTAAARAGVDAKHALLEQALTAPTAETTKTALTRLSGAVDRDPIVAFSFGRVALAGPTSPDVAERVRRAVAVDPANPLLLALGVEIAKQGGGDVAPAKTRLMAVASTPAERALATE
ncbi:Tetratricopeptide TPR_2 repeat protein [Labilithrix luteola]|uniref:Tetratricopeptide TPR_2 repeat protein n=1 Tax=Labilithrix luteola TaxID=1391654 RepID=A0A0K1Q8M3_9BACT|nr:Tetratricopeptide TPR_2 repeat protein [Labilithrix luteola]